MERSIFLGGTASFQKQRSGTLRALRCAVLLLVSLVSVVAHAQDDTADSYSVGLCNISFSIKLKSFGQQLKAVNPAYVDAWKKERPGDSASRCRRLYADSDKSRLAKLVSIGKAEKSTHLVAPTAGKKGNEIEVSFWLVDVQKGEVIGKLEQTFPLDRKQMKSALPEFSQKAVEKFLPLLGADVQSTSEPKAEAASAPVDNEVSDKTKTANVDSNQAASETADAAGETSEPQPTATAAQATETSPSVPATPTPLAQVEAAVGERSAAPSAQDADSESAPETEVAPLSSSSQTKPAAESQQANEPTEVKPPQTSPDVAQMRHSDDGLASPHPVTGASVISASNWDGDRWVPLASAALGGVAGAGLGALVHQFTVAERNRSTDGSADLGQSVWVGTLLGAGVGALVGAWASTTDVFRGESEKPND